MNPRLSLPLSQPAARPFIRLTPGARPEVPRAGVPADASPLTVYFRDLSGTRVMTRDEEIAAAARIAGLRQAYWRALLRRRPPIAGLCLLARELLPDEPAVTDILAGPAADAGEPSEAAYERLALALAELDRDGVVSEHLFADLERGASPWGTAGGLAVASDEHVELLRHFAEVRAARAELGEARGAFVRANLRLVVVIARRFNRCPLPLADMIQEGNLGLIKAVDRYDHRRGFRFSTYGSWWIRHAIGRAMADKTRAVRLPSHTIRTFNQVTRARRDLEARDGQWADDGEVARVTGLSPQRIHRMNCSLREEVSLARPQPATDGLTLLDALADPRTPEVSAMMDLTCMLANLRDMLGSLSPMEVDVLRKRVGMDDEPEQTLHEIGETYSLSRERIRQVQAQALQKLRAEFKRRNLL